MPDRLLPVRFPRSFFVDRPEGDEVCHVCLKRLRDPRAEDCPVCERHALDLINALRTANGLDLIAAADLKTGLRDRPEQDQRHGERRHQ